MVSKKHRCPWRPGDTLSRDSQEDTGDTFDAERSIVAQHNTYFGPKPPSHMLSETTVTGKGECSLSSYPVIIGASQTPFHHEGDLQTSAWPQLAGTAPHNSHGFLWLNFIKSGGSHQDMVDSFGFMLCHFKSRISNLISWPESLLISVIFTLCSDPGLLTHLPCQSHIVL
jgi:hypothetical protein